MAARGRGAAAGECRSSEFLGAVSPGGFSERIRGFHQGLKDTGYVEGENVAIEYRWAENQLDRLPDLAANMARKGVAVIAAHGGTAPVSPPRRQPRPFRSCSPSPEDPVKLGLVASLSPAGR